MPELCTIKGSAKILNHKFMMTPIEPTNMLSSALGDPGQKDSLVDLGLRIGSGGEKRLEELLERRLK